MADEQKPTAKTIQSEYATVSTEDLGAILSRAVGAEVIQFIPRANPKRDEKETA